VDCVVGMSSSISDDAARHFAVGFYGGLGEHESVGAAFRQGRTAISLEGLDEAAWPRLIARAGVNADQLVLTSGTRRSRAIVHPDRLETAVEASQFARQPALARSDRAAALVTARGRHSARVRGCRRIVRYVGKASNLRGVREIEGS
jgi:hypothetical protein